MLYVNSNEEEKSFKGLYLKYYDSIYNYIYRSVLNREASEDILNTLNVTKEEFSKEMQWLEVK